ncbi:hypothetical protein BH11CYA1_BH11CYA1_06820 [soil metagenome]
MSLFSREYSINIELFSTEMVAPVEFDSGVELLPTSRLANAVMPDKHDSRRIFNDWSKSLNFLMPGMRTGIGTSLERRFRMQKCKHEGLAVVLLPRHPLYLFQQLDLGLATLIKTNFSRSYRLRSIVSVCHRPCTGHRTA